MASFAEVLCPDFPFRTGCNSPKMAGDRVMIGINSGPIYEIVHVAGPHAWIRQAEQGLESLVRLDRLRLIEPARALWPVI